MGAALTQFTRVILEFELLGYSSEKKRAAEDFRNNCTTFKTARGKQPFQLEAPS